MRQHTYCDFLALKRPLHAVLVAMFWRRISVQLIVVCLVRLAAPPAYAQTATLSGFVWDVSDGRPLEGATVALRDVDDEAGDPIDYGTVANADGVYLVRGIDPGSYLVEISFIGYQTFHETITFDASARVARSIGLEPSEEALDEVLVQGERETGAARVTAGHQRIRPEDVQLVPAPDLSADLASYLTTLPGIVTTGDRGGQFFVRGGEPSQNLTMLDGMILYQPFHVIGSYSAFPADIISRADLYVGGFSAQYAGRLSAVIDVASRAGNNRSFAGQAGISPFVAAGLVEGPIIPGHLSFIGSVRRSLIDRAGESIYREELPFEFHDAFGKLHLVSGRRSRLSASGVTTSDRGTLVSEIETETEQEVRWANKSYGVRWLYLPRILNVSSDLEITRSEHEMSQGVPGDTVRSTSVTNTRIALHANFFGDDTTNEAGWDVVFSRAHNKLGGLFQNLESTSTNLPSFGFFVEPELLLGGVRLEPGLRLQFYNVRVDPYLEPRIRAQWERGVHVVTGAIGVYQQHVIGLSDRRDASSVFTAWTGIPRRERDIEEQTREGVDLLRGRLGQAVHVLTGYRSAPAPWLEYSAEAYYKRLRNLFVGEWSAIPRLTTRLQKGTGRSIGFEARVELRRGGLYGYATYGLSSTVYSADSEPIRIWYGQDELAYRPAHDRRHQVNVLVSYAWRGFDASVRWAFGSGLPYTRPLAFDGFVLIDDIHAGLDMERWRRVIFDRPFGSRLPAYHRLDVSIERRFELGWTSATLQASVLNVYDRRNIFYFDTFTLERKDQLPIIPSLGLRVAFD